VFGRFNGRRTRRGTREREEKLVKATIRNGAESVSAGSPQCSGERGGGDVTAREWIITEAMANREATKLCSIVVVGCENTCKLAGALSNKPLKAYIETLLYAHAAGTLGTGAHVRPGRNITQPNTVI
jgi:hypothetical protein